MLLAQLMRTRVHRPASSASEPPARVQRPQHEHRLEEQPHQPLGVGVEVEGVGALDVLGDVAGEDDDEEDGEQGTEQPPVPRQARERGAEHDLHHPGHHDDEVGVHGEPLRYLRLELLPPARQMGDPRPDHGQSEGDPGSGGQRRHAGESRWAPWASPADIPGRGRRPHPLIGDLWVTYCRGVDDDLVFKALADPTRRLLMDALHERDGRTLGELEDVVAARVEMTRFGVSKHLRLLEAAGLVTTRRVGRVKEHYLNPVPIQQIHRRWIGKYTDRARTADALLDLKERLEDTTEKGST